MAIEMRQRFIYSLLKPAVRAAARFRVPIKPLLELVRLAYFEHLSHQGLSTNDIAERFGQTTRHMQSLSRRLKEDFFTAERAGGLVREIEAHVAQAMPNEEELIAKFNTWTARDVRSAIDILLSEERVEKNDEQRLQTAKSYVVMREDGFHHRIDSLNHFLDGAYRGVLHRLLFDNKKTAMMKAISFSAIDSELEQMLAQFEGELRRKLSTLDENATFQGRAEERYTILLSSAPMTEQMQGDNV